MSGVDLSVMSVLGTLLVAAFAIFQLARRTRHDVGLQMSGMGCIAAGLLVLNFARDVLPHSPNAYEVTLAPGIAFFGPAIVFAILSMKRWPQGAS